MGTLITVPIYGSSSDELKPSLFGPNRPPATFFFYWDEVDRIHSILQDQVVRDGVFTMFNYNATMVFYESVSLNR
jgi:hypothetical protein